MLLGKTKEKANDEPQFWSENEGETAWKLAPYGHPVLFTDFKIVTGTVMMTNFDLSHNHTHRIHE